MMKKLLLIALAGVMISVFSAPVIAQEPVNDIKDFSQIEIGALITVPNQLVGEDKVGVVPSFMLKQSIIDRFFTLQALETNLGTGLTDTTAFKLGFGYALPSFNLFNYEGLPVEATVDLLFAKDLVTGLENNNVLGAGLRLDYMNRNNLAFITRIMWNNRRVEGTEDWSVVWSGIVGLEIGLL
jgi:hypothetical protein